MRFLGPILYIILSDFVSTLCPTSLQSSRSCKKFIAPGSSPIRMKSTLNLSPLGSFLVFCPFLKGVSGWGGVPLFEGTTPAPAQNTGRQGPLTGQPSNDPGVDISQFAGSGGLWKKLAGG